MNEHLTFDRVLLAALADGPTGAPSSVVNAAMNDTQLMPQRHARIARLDTQAWPAPSGSLADPGLRRGLRLVLVAAVVVALLSTTVVVGMKLLQQPFVPLRTNSLVSAGQLPDPIGTPIVQRLSDGRLLIGGETQKSAIAVVFDPATGQSVRLESGFASVSLQATARLDDGRIVLLGWRYADVTFGGQSRAWVFDPVTTTLSTSVATLQSRFSAAAASLPDGRVAILGGQENDSSASTRKSTEFLDPATMRMTPGPDMGQRREGARAAAVGSRVLIIGGVDVNEQQLSNLNPVIELFDPASGLSETVGQLGGKSGRSAGALVTLSDGRLLILGRQIGPQLCGRHQIDPISAQVFDPASGKLSDAAPMGHDVLMAVATADGRVVVAGQWQATAHGCETDADYLINNWVGIYEPSIGLVAESVDPIDGSQTLPFVVHHRYAAGALLADGRVVLVGDDDPSLGVVHENVIDILSLEAR